MIDDLTRNILEQRDNIENQRNREIKSNEKSYTTEDLLLFIDKLRRENKQLKTLLMQDHHKIHELADVIEEVREYNNQIIKDTKDFYRPTEDIIYSGDTLIDLAETNIQILDKVKGELENE